LKLINGANLLQSLFKFGSFEFEKKLLFFSAPLRLY